MPRLTLALDAMGGDFGPPVTVPAALAALSRFPNLHIQLFGDAVRLRQQLGRQSHDRLDICHAPEEVTMADKPAQVLRSRRQSSMWLALEAVAAGRADGCVSAGNTGALMSMAKLQLKTLPGIERPALVAALPTHCGGRVHMLDLGANVDCSAETLFQFALMGHVKARLVEGIARPRVALLNVGAEEVKGTEEVRQAARMLGECRDLQYTGFIEGNDLFSGRADVIVCDGFVGNVCLKTGEGLTQFLVEELKGSLKPRWLGKLVLPLLLPGVAKLLKTMNPDQYNGASLLGLRAIVVKSHGNADIPAFVNAIGEAVVEVQRQVPARIKDQLEAALL
ncbi:MAG: phosphate acyltransferase PlsX [Gammaproteobacteria bacterium]|nr:phosphate acyltransferase PlsX [Gammaproteobacteria bacterium]